MASVNGCFAEKLQFTVEYVLTPDRNRHANDVAQFSLNITLHNARFQRLCHFSHQKQSIITANASRNGFPSKLQYSTFKHNRKQSGYVCAKSLAYLRFYSARHAPSSLSHNVKSDKSLYSRTNGPGWTCLFCGNLCDNRWTGKPYCKPFSAGYGSKISV